MSREGERAELRAYRVTMAKKIGFDNRQYLETQSAHIRERIAQFGGKLYLEFGGKLFDDYHAARVLPGFEPDSKIRMLLELRESVEIVVVINASAIEQNKVRGDLGITYDEDVLRLVDTFREKGLYVGSVTITLYTDITEGVVIPEGRTVTLDLNGYTLTAPEGAAALTNSGTLTVEGGSIAGDITTAEGSVGQFKLVDITLNGEAVFAEDSGMYTYAAEDATYFGPRDYVVGVGAAASIGTAVYASLADAMEAAEDGATIVLIADLGDAHCSDRSVERDVGDRDCAGSCVDGHDIGSVGHIGGDDRGNDLDLASECLVEERPHRAVDKAGYEYLLILGPGFPLQEASWDLSSRIVLLVVFDRYGNVVDRLRWSISAADRSDDGAACILCIDRAIGLLCDPAGLEYQVYIPDPDRY